MKKYIVMMTVAAFAVVGYAGDKAGANKNKAASADKAAACPASAESSCCANAKVAKKDGTKKIVQSPKAAGEAGR